MTSKNHFNVSLFELFAVVTLVAVALVCLRNTSELTMVIVEIGQLLIFGIAAIFVAQRSSQRRSFWIAFLLMNVASYHYIRQTQFKHHAIGWIFFNVFKFTDGSQPNYGGRFVAEGVVYPDYFASINRTKADLSCFEAISNVALALLFSVIAGWLAKCLWRNEEERKAALSATPPAPT